MGVLNKRTSCFQGPFKANANLVLIYCLFVVPRLFMDYLFESDYSMIICDRKEKEKEKEEKEEKRNIYTTARRVG